MACLKEYLLFGHDYVAQIIFAVAISGYKWHLSWIFMFLLKSNKLFVTNLSTIFILGILNISNASIWEFKTIGFVKVKALLKIAHWLIWCRERILGQNWQPSWILSPLVIKKQFLNNFIIFCTLKNRYLEIKVVYLWWLEVRMWNILFLAFRIFFVVAILKMPQERQCIPKYSC